MKNKTTKSDIKWKFFGITFFIILIVLLTFFIGLIMDTFISPPQSQLDNDNNYNEALILYSENNEFYIGNPNAIVILTEYSDPQCPFCKKYNKKVYKQIVKDYIDTGKVKYVFKYFPQDFHKNSFNASLAIECAREQSKGATYKSNIFDLKKINIASLKTLAINLKLDPVKFNDCLDSQKYEHIIYANIEEAKSLQIKGTPTLIINDIEVEELKPYSYYKKIIDIKLNQ